jgi:plastocyanin
MRSTLVFAALGTAALVAAASFWLATPVGAKTVQVETGNFYFCSSANENTPCETTGVVVGDTVTWNNVSGSHQVAQCTDATYSNCSGGFNTGSFSSGQTKSQVMNTAGDIYYHCDFHTNMKGKIIVSAQTASPTPTQAGGTGSPTGAASGTATPVSLPVSGGAPAGGTVAWQYVLLAVGAITLAGAAAGFAVARARLR